MKNNLKKSVVGIVLILVAAFVTSVGQFLWKAAAISNGKIKYILMALGFFLFVANGFLVVISYRFGELSVLQPILSAGFVFSLLLGKIFFHEQQSIFKYLGISSILIGVFVLAHSGQVESVAKEKNIIKENFVDEKSSIQNSEAKK